MSRSKRRKRGKVAAGATAPVQPDLLSEDPEDVSEAEEGTGAAVRETEHEKSVTYRSKARRQAVVFEMVAEEAPEAGSRTTAGDPLARAKELVQDGKIERAMALYREILSRNPSNLKARNNLGVLFDELGQHELALEQFEAAERTDPENVEVLNNLGSTLGSMARYEAAERTLRHALRIEPGNIEVHASIGILAFRRGVYHQAEMELRWVCEQDPTHGPAFFYRGEALNRLGRVDEAMDALERAIVLQPTNGKAFYTLGILYDRKLMNEEAGVMYRRARELTTG